MFFKASAVPARPAWQGFRQGGGGECQDVAVQAGWRDRSDLLGHYNAFEKRFAEKECLRAVSGRYASARDRLNIVLLDEMNLSRPEQYFADFLSALEKEPDDRWIRLVESRPPNAPGMFREGREVRLPQNLGSLALLTRTKRPTNWPTRPMTELHWSCRATKSALNPTEH
jgi:hypothetical protein